jgi:hypothetical protein
MGKQVKSKTPAIRKDTRDRDIDRKQLTQTDREDEFARFEDADGGMKRRMEGGKGKQASGSAGNKCE